MDAVRGIGIERGVDVVLHLLFVRWMTLNDPTGKEWRTLTAASTDDELRVAFDRLAILNDPDPDPSPGLDTTTYVSALRDAVHVLDRHITADDADARAMVAATFEEVLGSLTNLGKQAGEADTPRGLAELLVALTVKGGAAVLDPACGNGTGLLVAARAHPDVSVSGFEINRRISRRASMRLMIHGVEGKGRGFGAWQGDAFFEYGEGLYDAVIVQPPWGLNFDEDHVDVIVGIASKYSGSASFRPPKADMPWLLLALDALAADGRAAVVLSGSSTDRKCSDTHQVLLAHDAIEAIISMPPGIFSHTMVSTELWLLRAPPDQVPSQPTPVLLMDTATLIGPSERGRSEITRSAIDAIVDVVTAHRTGHPFNVPDHVAGRFDPSDLDPTRGISPARYLPDPPVELVVHPSPERPLLSAVNLANFKAFGGTADIPMAPLTLLYGANSAGKSSIIQALLMLKQSRAADAVQTQGPITNLGGFAGLLHGHTAESIEIGFTYGVAESWIPAAGTPDPTLMRSVSWAFAADASMHGRLTESQVRFGEYSLTFGPDDTDGTVRTVTLDNAANAFMGVATGTLLYPFDSRFYTEGEEKDQASRLKGRMATARRALKILEQDGTTELTLRASGLLGTAESLTLVRENNGDREHGIASSYVNRTARLAAGISYEVDQLFDNLVWLGPLRSAPQRVYDRADTSDATGDGRHVAIYLFDHASVVDDLNQWLKRLDIPYSLDVIPVSVGKTANLVGDLVAISLTDTRSGVTVTPADVGFGISQVLPIVVELLARRESVIAIEQPETHLHPRLQARLADLLIDATQEGARGNQVIVETHSEHLMLRVQRRIREGTLDPADVSVIYVDRHEATGQAVVLPLRLNDQGDFLDEWPRGFFDERLEELFGPF